MGGSKLLCRNDNHGTAFLLGVSVRMKKKQWSRRNILKTFGALSAGSVLGMSPLWRHRKAFSMETKKPRFLIVIGGVGGASIIDSFMPIKHSETTPHLINSYPDAEVKTYADSRIRALDRSGTTVGALPFSWNTSQSEFVDKHRNEMLVATMTGTSVNHVIAQKRSITGNGAWNGRTLQEAVATEYGEGFSVANANMSTMGFLEPGVDASIPTYAVAEPIIQPALWPLSLDASKGILSAPDESLLDMARTVRNSQLDANGNFYKTFQKSSKLKRWIQQQNKQNELESKDLITKLNFIRNSDFFPLDRYGLLSSPDAPLLEQLFPNYLLDGFDAQAALAYLMIKNGVSCSVTISPNFNVILSQGEEGPTLVNPPLAFDYSHNAHQATQAVMWNRVLKTIDKLITLLKGVEFGDGESFWDRTLIYVATDFGRSKNRDSLEDFGSAHNLNNGVVIISPLVKGNTVLGDVDPLSGNTYGWDPITGATRGINTYNSEADIYSGILRAMGVTTTGSSLPTVTTFNKS